MKNNITQEKHLKRTYIDKTRNLLRICIAFLFISIVSYIIPYLIGESYFDFGIIFEIISFIFIYLALDSIHKNDFKLIKKNIIISMIPIGWLFIYDFIFLITDPSKIIELFMMYIYPSFNIFYLIYFSFYVIDLTYIAIILLQYKSYKSVCKASGEEKETDFAQDFYDKL